MWVLALVLIALVLAACGDSPSPRPAAELRPAADRHARNDCSQQSGADFPRAFEDPANFVVGPLVLVGGAYTDPATVREFGGNKFPLLVRAGHRVTIAVARGARAYARLAYGPLPQGETKMRDTHRKVTFVACDSAHAISSADGAAVTFWSGAVLTRRPACIPLEVSIDGGGAQRVGVPLGRRC